MLREDIENEIVADIGNLYEKIKDKAFATEVKADLEKKSYDVSTFPNNTVIQEPYIQREMHFSNHRPF